MPEIRARIFRHYVDNSGTVTDTKYLCCNGVHLMQTTCIHPGDERPQVVREIIGDCDGSCDQTVTLPSEAVELLLLYLHNKASIP